MNKKKVLMIGGIVVLVVLAIYLAFNPAWLTHPKYMLDKQYCEADSDCDQKATCGGVNIYNYDETDSFCALLTTGSQCFNNECKLGRKKE